VPYTNLISRQDAQPLLGKDQQQMPAFSGETGQAPLVYTMRMRHAAEGAAATDFSEVIGVAPFAGNVSGARFIPDTAVSGATATANTLAVLNKTQTLIPAALAYITGTDWVAFTSKSLTLGAAAAIVVVAGDVFSAVKTHASTGTAGPAGSFELDITRSDIA
jgi:hypothetical protein